MANTWNKAGTTWGYNSWQSDTVTVSITGLSTTSSVGTVVAYPEQGWGSDYWGIEKLGGIRSHYISYRSFHDFSIR